MGMIEQMQAGYVECALWSSTDVVDGKDVNLDSGEYDLSDNALDYLNAKCLDFYTKNEALIERFMDTYEVGIDYVGHSLWLSQNGHGAGFFDYGKKGELGDQLHEIAMHDETELYVGDDVIHVMGHENYQFGEEV